MRPMALPKPRILKVFVDTNVLFAAVYSSTGSAHDLIQLALQGRVTLFISRQVSEEVQRNLNRKAPEALPDYQAFVNESSPQIVAPPVGTVRDVADYVVAKDAMIVAAAIAAQVDYLVTYDRKHLLDLPEIAQKSGLKIVTPDVVVLEVEKSEDADSQTQGI
jgi:putative PIN family toxin of toxin-antitoxin system